MVNTRPTDLHDDAQLVGEMRRLERQLSCLASMLRDRGLLSRVEVDRLRIEYEIPIPEKTV